MFQEMVNVITEAGQRLERYEQEIASVVEGWRWRPVVQALMSLRGVALLTGATLVAGLVSHEGEVRVLTGVASPLLELLVVIAIIGLRGQYFCPA